MAVPEDPAGYVRIYLANPMPVAGYRFIPEGKYVDGAMYHTHQLSGRDCARWRRDGEYPVYGEYAVEVGDGYMCPRYVWAGWVPIADCTIDQEESHAG